MTIISFTSCKTDCEMLAQVDKNSECLIIVEELLNSEITKLNAKGRNLNDGYECVCKEDNRWWYLYRNQIERGDTIIKKKGELTFKIHKKDTILTYNWECDGKVYE